MIKDLRIKDNTAILKEKSCSIINNTALRLNTGINKSNQSFNDDTLDTEKFKLHKKLGKLMKISEFVQNLVNLDMQPDNMKFIYPRGNLFVFRLHKRPNQYTMRFSRFNDNIKTNMQILNYI